MGIVYYFRWLFLSPVGTMSTLHPRLLFFLMNLIDRTLTEDKWVIRVQIWKFLCYLGFFFWILPFICYCILEFVYVGTDIKIVYLCINCYRVGSPLTESWRLRSRLQSPRQDLSGIFLFWTQLNWNLKGKKSGSWGRKKKDNKRK